jgi:hypothetical protein
MLRVVAALVLLAVVVSLLGLNWHLVATLVPESLSIDDDDERRTEQRLQALEWELSALQKRLRHSSRSVASPPPPQLKYQPPPPPPHAPARVPSNDPVAAARFSSTDAACNSRDSAGYGGGSLGWGMSFKVTTAQECCDACRAHAATCAGGNGSSSSEGAVYYRRRWEGTTTEERCPKTMSSNEEGTHRAQPCNVFVFCPTPPADGGLCWSNDVWNHSYGECWLKHQANPAKPWAGAYGAYPAGYRRKHKTTPPYVQWLSGSLVPKGTGAVPVDGPHWHW